MDNIDAVRTKTDAPQSIEAPYIAQLLEKHRQIRDKYTVAAKNAIASTNSDMTHEIAVAGQEKIQEEIDRLRQLQRDEEAKLRIKQRIFLHQQVQRERLNEFLRSEAAKDTAPRTGPRHDTVINRANPTAGARATRQLDGISAAIERAQMEPLHSRSSIGSMPIPEMDEGKLLAQLEAADDASQFDFSTHDQAVLSKVAKLAEDREKVAWDMAKKKRAESDHQAAFAEESLVAKYQNIRRAVLRGVRATERNAAQVGSKAIANATDMGVHEAASQPQQEDQHDELVALLKSASEADLQTIKVS